MNSRRNFLKQAGLASAATLIQPLNSFSNSIAENNKPMNISKWLDGSKLVVSISMQFESGGEPEFAESPFPRNMKPGYIDLPAKSWYQYGYKEGIQRMLDNWDRLGIKVTSHMVGNAVLNNPKLAKEIVDRGHEAAAHGMSWSAQYDLSIEQEKKFISDGVNAILKATGAKSIGYNANWMRRGTNTLSILQELGFVYHIDDLSRDEPFITQANNHNFVVVPYTLRCNDIQLIEGKNFSTDQFIHQVKMEFDQLYYESQYKRRLLSISFHDRIGGTPQMVNAAYELIQYMNQHPGVSFKRKDEIALMTLNDPTSIKE